MTTVLCNAGPLIALGKLELLDDETARAEVRRLKLRVRGTLSVLAQAYHAGHLSLPEIELLL